MDKRAAGIKETDIMGMPFTIHGLRQSFSVWLDEAGVPSGARSALLCHADTLAEARYNHQDLEKLRAELHKLPDPWPDGMRVVPPRGGHGPDGENGRGTNENDRGVKSQSPICPQGSFPGFANLHEGRYISPATPDPPVKPSQAEVIGSMTVPPGVAFGERESRSLQSASSGPALTGSFRECPFPQPTEGAINALDHAVLTLSMFIRSRLGPSGPANGHDADRSHPA